MATGTGNIFISYRRKDAPAYAGWLFDRLAAHFGRERIFRDVDTIDLGDDFQEVLRAKVAQCEVLLALVGQGWADARDKTGRRRLDDPADIVRIELETALKRNVRVIPVLIEGAGMPDDDA